MISQRDLAPRADVVLRPNRIANGWVGLSNVPDWPSRNHHHLDMLHAWPLSFGLDRAHDFGLVLGEPPGESTHIYQSQ